MKKLLSLMLSAAFMVSLAACGDGGATTSDGGRDTTSVGSNSMTKEEMLEQAEAVTREDLFGAAESNIVSAKETYGGKLIIFTAQVLDIQDDHIQLGDSSYINVYLPTEDIMQIENYQLITVVGQLGDTIEEVEENVGYGMTTTLYCYEMPQAYLVLDRFEYTGTLKWKNESYEDAWDIEYNDDPVLKLIRFNESVDLSGFDESYCNEEITFTAKVFTPDYFNPGSFSDAIIIETGE